MRVNDSLHNVIFVFVTKCDRFLQDHMTNSFIKLFHSSYFIFFEVSLVKFMLFVNVCICHLLRNAYLGKIKYVKLCVISRGGLLSSWRLMRHQ